MRWSSSATRWSVVAGLALALAAALAPATVPIYDGIGNPDEPYRYVKPPAGYQETKAPTTAKAIVAVSNGRSAAAYVNTSEIGPQFSLFLPEGALAAPGTDPSISMTATPLAPSGLLPTDGTIVGNIYRITATAAGGAVDIVGFGDQVPTIDMRAPSLRQPGPVFEHLDNGHWSRSQTIRVGNDVYETRAIAFGEWALVQRGRTGANASNGSGFRLPLISGLLGALGFGLAVLAIRHGRTRKPAGEVSR